MFLFVKQNKKVIDIDPSLCDIVGVIHRHPDVTAEPNAASISEARWVATQ